jgi:hypothetical protein
MAWLTKSRFLSGLQCHKRLWFEIHQPLEQAIDMGAAILQGRSFDEVVQQLHPGVIVPRRDSMPAAIAETSNLLGLGAAAPTVMYQAAFRAGDLAVIADVLRRVGKNYELIEVKASTRVKETHIPDAAFQALVLRKAGISVKRVFIGHVNNQFVLHRKGEYDGLLAEADVTDAVTECMPAANAEAQALQRVMKQARVPRKEVGEHCTSPYECPFISRCHADLSQGPDYPVDLLPHGGKTVAKLLADGYEDLCKVPSDRLSSAVHVRVQTATVTGTPYFDVAATAALRLLEAPFSYLDFETITMAVPEIIGTRPYEQLPFQWSVHVETAGEEVSHAEFLAIENFGDFGLLAKSLSEAIPVRGTVFAYNASFERSVLNRLAELAPEYADPLHGIADRLFDLLPVVRDAYYHRDMQGSWSIKSVMPTIDASLNYGLMGEVQEGGAAQSAFMELRDPGIQPDRAAGLRAALLNYCEHDTWVMVILRRFLCEEPLGLVAHQCKPQLSAARG